MYIQQTEGGYIEKQFLNGIFFAFIYRLLCFLTIETYIK